MNRMNKILSFDELSGIVTSEAGVVKQDMDDFLDDKGYILPFDLGARVILLLSFNVISRLCVGKLLDWWKFINKCRWCSND